MPSSIRENDKDVRSFVVAHQIRTILDVGCGQGTYADLLPDVSAMDGFEVWHPYIKRFDLDSKYRDVYAIDVRKEPQLAHTYDLVIFGDVLEHMTREEAISVWKWASGFCKWGLISIPIIHYPQGAEEGNPYEEHIQEHVMPHEVKADYGPFDYVWLYRNTGTFIKRF